MPKDSSRIHRVSEQVRRDLAELIREEINDPRMAMVSITAVKVTRDLSHAKIYITLLGNPQERNELVDSLNQAAPMLRHGLGQRMRIRTVPRLVFNYDETVEQGARLSSLITEAIAADAAKYRDDEEN